MLKSATRARAEAQAVQNVLLTAARRHALGSTLEEDFGHMPLPLRSPLRKLNDWCSNAEVHGVEDIYHHILKPQTLNYCE